MRYPRGECVHIGEGIAEVEVVEWYVQPGDTIKADQTVADLMTDKATVEVPSPISGAWCRSAERPVTSWPWEPS
jgi:glycine cleavage system H lipoate-binding protein